MENKIKKETLEIFMENQESLSSAENNSSAQPQTIATIDVCLHFDAKAKFIEDQTECPLCGSELLLTHVTHFVNQSVKEEAHCEKCSIRVRDVQHSLQ